jgi:nitroreductase
MTMLADSLEDILDSRYSCRAFRDEPVPKATIDRILRMAARTASNNNAQPWQVIVTAGDGTDNFRRAMYDRASSEQAFYGKDTVELYACADFPIQIYTGKHKERRRTCGSQLYESIGLTREDKLAALQQSLENYNFFGAPHVAIVTTDKQMGAYGAIDCGSYVTTFLLAATSLGVASIAQGAFSIFSPFLKDYFAIPEDRLIVCGISFGYAVDDAPINGFRTSRVPIEEQTIWRTD